MLKELKTIPSGFNALDLVRMFPAKFPNMSRFYFTSYTPKPSIEQRLGLKKGRTLASLSIRKLLADHPDIDKLTQQLLKGIEADESAGWTEVRARDLTSRLPKLEAKCALQGKVLALYSYCRDLRGCECHVPMVDFRVESGDNYGQMNLLGKALKKLGESKGVLLNSGQSYHYYGWRPLSKSQWRRFMAGCLLLEPLVDVRYIAHRMLAGKCSLRLTSAPLKPKVPEVVANLQ